MADSFVPAFAESLPITVPAGSQIAVFSQGGFQVQRINTTANYPPTFALLRDQAAAQDQYVSGVLDASNAVTVKVIASGGQPTWYSVGTNPIVRSGGRLPSPSGSQALPANFAAINATATATVAQLLTGGITSTTAAAVVVTAPTAALIDAATTLAVGDSFDVVLINTGGTNALSISGGTGNTYIGTISTTVGGMTARFVKTAAGAFTVYRV